MSKINKLGKSTFVIAILSFLLVAVLAFGGTYAYFSDAAKADTTSITMGKLTLGDVTATTTIEKDAKVVPNQPIFSGDTTVAVDTTIAYFARVTMKISEVKLAGSHAAEDGCADAAIDLLSVTDAAGWTKDTEAAEDTYVYYDLTANAVSEDITITLNVKVNSEVGKQSSEHYMEATVTVNVTVEVIQADYILGDGSAVAPGTAAELATVKAAFAAADIKAAA